VESTILLILERGKSSLEQHLFRSVKSVHIHHFSFFLWTITTFASHCGYLTSLINPVSNNLCTSALIASIFSSDILWSFYFLGFASGLTYNLCLITSLLTPTKSEMDHVTMSLFLSRNCRSSACSCGLISVPMQTALSGTLGSSATLLKSPAALIAFLNSTKISFLDEGYSCS
jgi:hypothetical protein